MNTISPLPHKAVFITELEAGREQTVVTYGTSLTAGGAWVTHLRDDLEGRFPGLAHVVNSGEGGMWSQWGVENLEERVIAKRPDAVFIEFSINDAFLEHKTSTEDARRNLETMIDRIVAANSKCEIILMVMNPPTGASFEKRPLFVAYEDVYREVAGRRGLRLIDHSHNWHAILKNEPLKWAEYVPDNIHPTAEGCENVITPFLLESIGFIGK